MAFQSEGLNGAFVPKKDHLKAPEKKLSAKEWLQVLVAVDLWFRFGTSAEITNPFSIERMAKLKSYLGVLSNKVRIEVKDVGKADLFINGRLFLVSIFGESSDEQASFLVSSHGVVISSSVSLNMMRLLYSQEPQLVRGLLTALGQVVLNGIFSDPEFQARERVSEHRIEKYEGIFKKVLNYQSLHTSGGGRTLIARSALSDVLLDEITMYPGADLFDWYQKTFFKSLDESEFAKHFLQKIFDAEQTYHSQTGAFTAAFDVLEHIDPSLALKGAPLFKVKLVQLDLDPTLGFLAEIEIQKMERLSDLKNRKTANVEPSEVYEIDGSGKISKVSSVKEVLSIFESVRGALKKQQSKLLIERIEE